MSGTDGMGSSQRRSSTEPLHGLTEPEPASLEKSSIQEMKTKPEMSSLLETKPDISLLMGPDTVPDGAPVSDVLDGTSFRTIKELSEGGMGTIYLSEHRELGRRFAIKVLREEMNPTPDLVERLRREARAASLVSHPGIVDVTDFGVTGKGRPFVVMEHIEGRTLADVFDDDGVLEQRWSVVIALSLCEALAAVHEADFIHRDVKPENIFLVGDDEEQIKLVDFGLVLSPEHVDSRLTRHGVVFGTPSYMSPEQVRRRPLTPASDIYSLGVVLYEMVTGTVPFEAETAFEVLALKVRESSEPPSARMVGQPLHPGLELVILRCLEREPDDRYSTMLEVAEALSEVLDELDRKPEGPWAATRNEVEGFETEGTEEASDIEEGRGAGRWKIVLGVVVAMIAALGSGIALVHWARPEPLAPQTIAETVTSEVAPGSSSEPEVVNLSSPQELPSEPPTEPVEEEVKAISSDAGSSSREGSNGGRKIKRRPREDEPRGAQPSSRDMVAEGNRLLRRRQLTEAFQAFQRAARLNPGSSGAQAGLGRVAFERGQHGVAVTHLERALRARPGDNSLRLLLGSAYLRQGQSSRAVQQWEQILARDPNNRAARRLLDSVRGQ